MRYGPGPWRQIIAVSRDIKFRSLDQKPIPMMYLPFGQHYRPAMVLHVRTSQSKNLIEPLRREVQALDREVPVYDVGTFAEHLDEELIDQRLLATLAGFSALLAMLLASIGLYGVISHSVAQRTHEIGVRMALGAEAWDVLRMIVGQGLILTVAGLGIGGAAALALTRLVSSRLYGVSATDPVSFFAAALLIAIVAIAASYIPARLAARIDPAVSLRHE